MSRLPHDSVTVSDTGTGSAGTRLMAVCRHFERQCLELNSQCASEDLDEGDGEVGGVDVAVGFGADGESSEAAQPGVGAFDDPAVAGERVAGAGDASASAAALSLCLAGG